MSKMSKKGRKSRKDKKKHKMCAGLRCRNIVAKDSKKGTLCSVCRERLGTNIIAPGEFKKPTPEVKVEEPEQLSVADKLAALRRKVNG